MEHERFVAQINKELSKKNTSFDQFLSNVNLEKLELEDRIGKVALKGLSEEKGGVITKLTSIDVVFGRGK